MTEAAAVAPEPARDDVVVVTVGRKRHLTPVEQAMFDELDAKLAPGGEYTLAAEARVKARKDRDAEIRRLVGLEPA